MIKILFPSLLALASLLPISAAPPAVPAPEPVPTAAEDAMFATLAKEKYQLSPASKEAYFTLAKHDVLAELTTAGISLPEEFLAWVDATPDVRASVYASPLSKAGTLCQLYSLEIDLGKDVVRGKYTQLALTFAIVHSPNGLKADLTPRPLLKHVVPESPLKLVDTKDPKRELDVNDHIINFLLDHPVSTTRTIAPTMMVAVENPTDPSKPTMKEVPDPKGVPKEITETRPLVAWEVLHDPLLQEKFNAYMKSKGQTVTINCASPRGNAWKPNANRGPIMQAMNLFKAAYDAKGYLQARRDPNPTPAQAMAYFISNQEFIMPPENKRAWPLFPIESPWPATLYLAQVPQPVREADDMWQRYRDTGRIHTYGKYVGDIAQQPYMLQARSVSPYNFGYGSIQMMLKDGGVCGTMAGISSLNKLALGIPACTAGQPGHCALVFTTFNPANKTFNLKDEQFVTGGVTKTTPHANWIFDGAQRRRNMQFHQHQFWAMNYGLDRFLDAMVAYEISKRLSRYKFTDGPLAICQAGVTRSPYCIALIEHAQGLLATPTQNLDFWLTIAASFDEAIKTPGCAAANNAVTNGVYWQIIQKISALPAPEDKQEAQRIYSFLKEQASPPHVALVNYESKLFGVKNAASRVTADINTHIANDTRSDADALNLASKIEAMAANITDAAIKRQWATSCFALFKGKEGLFGASNVVTADRAAAAAAKLAGLPAPTLEEINQSLAQTMNVSLKQLVSAEKYDRVQDNLVIGRCIGVLNSIKDIELKYKWCRYIADTLRDHKDLGYRSEYFEKCNWKLVSTTQQSTVGKVAWQRGYAQHAIDANHATNWTTYDADPAKTLPPHSLIVDMQSTRSLSGFTYLPYFNPKATQLTVNHVAFYTSLDGLTWQLAAEKQFPDILKDCATPATALQKVAFAPRGARYFKFEAKGTVLPNSYLAVSEVGVIEK